VVAATTSSFGNGNSDVWIIKLNQDGSISRTCENSGIAEDSNATVTETNATVITTTAIPTNANIVVTATSATTTTTSETSIAQCSRSKSQSGQLGPT